MNLYLLQHGEALSKDDDPDRSLSEQGIADIELLLRLIAIRMKDVAIIHSPKTRARQTAERLARIAGISAISESSDLVPGGPIDGVLDTITKAETDLLIVGHQPWIGRMASRLLANRETEDLIGSQPGTLIELEESSGKWRVTSMERPSLYRQYPGLLSTGAHGRSIESLLSRPERYKPAQRPSFYEGSGRPIADLVLYRSMGDYLDEVNLRSALWQERQAFELNLTGHDEEPFFVPGFCAVCGNASEFHVDYASAFQRSGDGRLLPNWRESVVCNGCRLNNRQRAILDLVRNHLPLLKDDDIYLTEGLTPLYQYMSGVYENLIASEFTPDGEATYLGKAIRHEDLTQLSFEDESLECILTFDVLEHVPDTRAAISEIMRCLAPGGVVIATAPFTVNQYENITRARIGDDGNIEHLLEPEYHGNPTSADGKCLCFYHFGWQLLDQFRAAGAHDAGALNYYCAESMNIGNDQYFFIATK